MPAGHSPPGSVTGDNHAHPDDEGLAVELKHKEEAEAQLKAEAESKSAHVFAVATQVAALMAEQAKAVAQTGKKVKKGKKLTRKSELEAILQEEEIFSDDGDSVSSSDDDEPTVTKKSKKRYVPKHCLAATCKEQDFLFRTFHLAVMRGFPTFRAMVLAQAFVNRNAKEARIVAHNLDLNLRLLNKHPTLWKDDDMMDICEVNFRRLMSLIEHLDTNDWDLPTQMESIQTNPNADLSFVRKQALKQMKLVRQSRVVTATGAQRNPPRSRTSAGSNSGPVGTF